MEWAVARREEGRGRRALFVERVVVSGGTQRGALDAPIHAAAPPAADTIASCLSCFLPRSDNHHLATALAPSIDPVMPSSLSSLG